MKTEEVTKTVTHYIANDGKDFGEDKAACELYEFENPYVKDMERIPKLENIMFFYHRIDAYWCESQKDIDLCCQYFQEKKRQENLLTKQSNPEFNYLDSLCNGRFIYPGYYFIIKFNSSILDSYVMYSLSQMDNLWKVFLNQVPVDPEVHKRMKDIQKEFSNYVDDNTIIENQVEDIDETEPTTVAEIFDKIKSEQITKDTEIEIKNTKKNTPKVYTKENIHEYQSDKDKENKHDENE